MSNTLQVNDCFRDAEGRLYLADALKLLRDKLPVIATAGDARLDDAHGRILARDMTSPRNVPGHNNAAMDGYAFAHADAVAAGFEMPVSARQEAGDPAPARIKPGTAVRIFTGAIMPEGADTVSMEEDCEALDDSAKVRLPDALKAGANHRKAGEDVKKGDVILQRGVRMNAARIGLAAAMGFATLPLYRPLRVAVLSCGNELREPGDDLPEGGVYDTNRHMLMSLLRNSGFCVVSDLGILPDEWETVQVALADAARGHDVILSSAGASKSEVDHVVRGVKTLGDLHVWQVAIKPGRPLAFGVMGADDAPCVFVGLPGNPVAAGVCTMRIAMPLLRQLAGGAWEEPRSYKVPAGFAMTKKPNRREFLRVHLVPDGQGGTMAKKFARDGSGILTSVTETDGVIEVAEDVTAIAEGDMLDFIPYSGLGI